MQTYVDRSRSTHEANWDKGIEEDIQTECNEKYGPVVHVSVARDSTVGEVYIKFKDVESGKNAILGLNGRWFGGRRITAQYLVEAVYNVNFPKASNV